MACYFNSIKNFTANFHTVQKTNRHIIAPDDSVVRINNWLYDDIRLTHAESKFTTNSFHTGHSDADVVRLHFGLKGDYEVSYKQIGSSFDLLGGHHNMFYSKEFDLEFFNKSLQIETFGIQFPKDFFIRIASNASDELKRFSEKIMQGTNALFAEKWAPIDLPIQQVIQQIIQNNYRDGLQEMFLLSKSIELLVLSAAACTNVSAQPYVLIKSKADKEKIIAARDIINSNLKKPPNLTQLARMTGLNEYKLKHGFKEVFSTTVFNYLTGQRLHLALKYLQDTELSVAEIAFEMGYATPQHFNNAFRKKFGTTPNSVRKNP